MELDEIRGLDLAQHRAAEATKLINAAEKARQIRNQAIHELRREGLTHQRIAQAAGVSLETVRNVLR